MKAIGALARITPEHLVSALSLASSGRVYDLGLELNNEIPQGLPRQMAGFRLTAFRHPTSIKKEYGIEFSTELLVGTPHVSTHVDALNHHQRDGRIFGGASVEEAFDDFGWKQLGMETVAPIIGRGILLDVAGSEGVDRLADRVEILPEHLERCRERQGTEVRDGDVVLVRTGKIADYYADPVGYVASQPGLGVEAATSLYEEGMAVLGTDTTATEPMPPLDNERTTHVAMLVERGVHLLENVMLDELAQDRVYEFLFVCLPIKITGSSGSWVRPVAIV
jgi:kynurenine formamidase